MIRSSGSNESLFRDNNTRLCVALMPYVLHFQGVTVREEEEEEESCSTQVESDICNRREGLQRAFEVLRGQMVSVFTNDQERRCAELWASVKTTMRSTADKCL